MEKFFTIKEEIFKQFIFVNLFKKVTNVTLLNDTVNCIIITKNNNFNYYFEVFIENYELTIIPFIENENIFIIIFEEKQFKVEIDLKINSKNDLIYLKSKFNALLAKFYKEIKN